MFIWTDQQYLSLRRLPTSLSWPAVGARDAEARIADDDANVTGTACSEAPVKNLSKASVKFLAALGPHAKLPAEMSIFPTLGAPPRRKCQSLRLSGALLPPPRE